MSFTHTFYATSNFSQAQFYIYIVKHIPAITILALSGNYPALHHHIHNIREIKALTVFQT
jgi:hypothetical protein